MPFLNDYWTNEIHHLGFQSFAGEVRQLLVHAPTPFAITIGGRWGAGKTSMLKTLLESLGGDADSEYNPGYITPGLKPDTLPADRRKVIRCVWFNPWQYQNESNPLIPLLHEIREQIRLSYLRAGVAAGAYVAVDTAIRSLARLADMAINLTTGSRGKPVEETLAGAEKAGEAYRARHYSSLVEAQRFQKEFEEAIRQAVCPDKAANTEHARLVVFIDDLDRCGEQAVFTLLEAIRLYLSSRHCVYVFGLDRNHVETAVRRVSKGMSRSEAAMYVDKMFQIRLQLPVPSPETMTKFLKQCCTEMNMALDDFQAENLALLLPPNPRLVKNFLNGLLFHGRLIQGVTDEQAPVAIGKGVALTAYLHTFFQDIYEILALLQDGALNDLLQVCRDADVNNDRQVYFRYWLENPLLVVGKTGVDMNEERFANIRGDAWRSKALGLFKEEFYKFFSARLSEGKSSDYEAIQPFLISTQVKAENP